jgi:hypothetical protein
MAGDHDSGDQHDVLATALDAVNPLPLHTEVIEIGAVWVLLLGRRISAGLLPVFCLSAWLSCRKNCSGAKGC